MLQINMETFDVGVMWREFFSDLIEAGRVLGTGTFSSRGFGFWGDIYLCPIIPYDLGSVHTG